MDSPHSVLASDMLQYPAQSMRFVLDIGKKPFTSDICLYHIQRHLECLFIPILRSIPTKYV